VTLRRSLFLALDGSSLGTVPLDARLAHVGLIADDGAAGLSFRQGVFYDGGGAMVTGTTATGTMTYQIRAAAFCLQLLGTIASGPVLLSNDGNVTVNTTNAPGANSRIDVIWIRQQAVAADGGADVINTAIFGVTQGTAAASPTVPAIPTGAMALAQFTVPAGTTQTSPLSNLQVHPWTTAQGSPIPVRNSTEQAALTVFQGMTVLRLDLDAILRVSATGVWEREAAQLPGLANGHKPRRILTRTSTFTVNDSVNQTVGGWAGAGAGGDDGDTTGIVLSSSGGTSNLLTVARGGLYRITFANAFAANATGLRQAAIWKNPVFTGANITGGIRVNTASSPASAAGVNTVIVVAEVVLADGDTIAVSAFQSSGAGLTSGSTVDGSEFWHVVRDDD
jgi:hypothetical protein